MASLRRRGSNYYIVFTRRLNGDLDQSVTSLGTDSKRRAERLKFELEEKAASCKLDPFEPGRVRTELRWLRRGAQNGLILDEVGRRFLESRSHVSGATRQNYERRLDRLKNVVGATMPVRLIEEQDIRRFCFQSHLSRASQRTYLRYCKMLFKWMAAEGYVSKDPAADIRYPRQNDKISNKIVAERQLGEIIRAHKSLQRKKILRGQRRGLHVWFRPLTMLGFYSGMRRSEMLRLTWDNVDLEREFIEVTDTKAGGERVIPIPNALLATLKAWHRACGRPGYGLVFFKKRFANRLLPLKADHVTQIFKKYVRAADLPDTVNLHGLRHSCATWLLRQGMDLLAVSKILGHASTSMTMTYEHLNHRDLKRRMREVGL